MSDSQTDEAQAFSDFEHAGWQSAGGGYHEHFGDLTRQTIAPLLKAVGAGDGIRLLDVATGPGYAAGAATERAAEVIGLDFSSGQVALAQRNYPSVTFQEGDAENLTFEEASFDAVVSNFGMLHFPHPERAMAEAHRVLRGGGRFGFTVWSTADKAIGFGIILAAIQAHGDMDVPLPTGPSFFRFSEAEECSRCLDDAGFTVPDVKEIPMTWVLPDVETLVQAAHEGTVRTAALLKAQTPNALQAIEAAIHDGTAQYVTEGGRVEIPMSATLASARKA